MSTSNAFAWVRGIGLETSSATWAVLPLLLAAVSATAQDFDADGIPDASDNCLVVANGPAEDAQADADADGIGDACECGDFNRDGIANTTDARLIQRCAVGQIPCDGLCDANGDGLCNTTDARLIQRLAVGQLDQEVVECAERPSSVRLVGSEGGVVDFTGGARLDVPPGALSSPVAISWEELPCQAIDPTLSAPAFASHDKRCLARFASEPDGLVFAAPIIATLPVPALQAGEIAVAIEVDPETQAFRIAPTTLAYDGVQGTVSLSVTHFSEQTVAGARSRSALPGEIVALPACCNETPTPLDCCCTTFDVEAAGGDFVSGECQIVGEQITVTFFDCPGAPEHTDTLSETSGECPEDLRAEIVPADPTLWVCQDFALGAELVGTNSDGSEFRAALPVVWTVTADTADLALTDQPPSGARIRGGQEGTARVAARSPADPAFEASTTVTIRSLAGPWTQELLSGSQTCSVEGVSWVEDEGPSTVPIEVAQDCLSATVTIPPLPEAAPLQGTLEATGNPVEPFGFTLSVSGEATIDCIVFFDTNAGDIAFGDEPVCAPPNRCNAVSCNETVTNTGTIASAELGSLLGISSWEFRATIERIFDDEPLVTESITCIGSAEFSASKQ